MTKKIAWVTDTAALLNEDFIKEHNIHVLPLSVVFEDGVLRETVDMTQDEFYDKLRKTKAHPKTSQPAIGEMVSLYEKLKEDGYTCAIAVHTSSQLSGTYQSSIAAGEMANFKVYSIDSKIGSYPMMKMIEYGQKLIKEGQDVEYVVKKIQDVTDQTALSFIPSSLSQLHKSGRVTGTQAFLSNLLNIKLVISFDNGKVEMKEKVRTFCKAKKYVTDQFREEMQKNPMEEVAIIHCNNEKEATGWKADLQEEFPNLNTLVLPLSAAVGVHAGEGTTGLSWVTF
ncbi:DegV family protein [Rummeliibacillus sp. NPDC094406]|uniref:DegV family protein n=1 Tax=Rummeliibacillus sp. NPDC094406 TaxID=3364511 RepID=UPI0038251002